MCRQPRHACAAQHGAASGMRRRLTLGGAEGQEVSLAAAPHLVAEARLTGGHPVEVALQRVDLAVVAQHAHGLRQGPLGHRVGGEPEIGKRATLFVGSEHVDRRTGRGVCLAHGPCCRSSQRPKTSAHPPLLLPPPGLASPTAQAWALPARSCTCAPAVVDGKGGLKPLVLQVLEEAPHR